MRKQDYKLISEAMATSNNPREKAPPGSVENPDGLKPGKLNDNIYSADMNQTDQYNKPNTGQPQMIGNIGEPAGGIPAPLGRTSFSKDPDPITDGLVSSLKQQNIDPVSALNNPMILNNFATSAGIDVFDVKTRLTNWVKRVTMQSQNEKLPARHSADQNFKGPSL